MQTSLKPIQAILILDADGKRICAKYYNSHYPTEKKQLEFEKKLYIKLKNSTTRTDGPHARMYFACVSAHSSSLPSQHARSVCAADIAMLGSSIIVFKNCADVSFCVVGEEDGVSTLVAPIANAFPLHMDTHTHPPHPLCVCPARTS